jgi:hypothetical protein
MEVLDIVDESGQPTGRTVSREEAHREGILHRTAHDWVVREEGGRTEILLQKRRKNPPAPKKSAADQDYAEPDEKPEDWQAPEQDADWQPVIPPEEWKK